MAAAITMLTPMMLALLGAFLLRDLFNSLRILINNTFEQNVIYDMRCDVYARLQRLPVRSRAPWLFQWRALPHRQRHPRRLRAHPALGQAVALALPA